MILACWIICQRVSSAVSTAKSVSLIRLRAAETFSEILLKLRIVDWNLFCIAPRSARFASMIEMASNTATMALEASATVATDMSSPSNKPAAPKPLVRDMFILIVCPGFAPTRKADE